MKSKTYYLDFCRNAKTKWYPVSYLYCQNKRRSTFHKTGINKIIQWGYNNPKRERNIVDTELYAEFKGWFEEEVHAYYLWKPYIIHDLLLSIDDGDVIVFWDCNPNFCEFNFSFDGFLKRFVENYDLICGVEIPFLNKEWTKRDCFELMQCADDRYHSKTQPQIQVAWSVWKKTPQTMRVASEWLHWCKNENVIRHDLGNICGKANFSGFRKHRWEQSVLTNIAIKYDCPTVKCSASEFLNSEKIRRQYSDECKNIENYLLKL